MRIHWGGTTFDQTMVGHIQKGLKYLPFLRGRICIAKDGIANLLSMKKLVKEGYCVTMDCDVENAINFYNEDGPYIKFVCVQDRFCCMDLDSSCKYNNCFTTVAEQKDHFSNINNTRVSLA